MTNWNDQTSALMKLWAETGQQMMANWTTLAQSASQNAPGVPTYGAVADIWREMTVQGIRAATQDADSTASDVAEKLFASQSAMLKMLTLTTQVWEAILPVIQKGGDWEAALREQLDVIRAQLVETGGTHTAQNLNQQWQQYVQQWQSVMGMWLQNNPQNVSGMGGLFGGNGALLEMTQLYWDAFNDSIGQLLQMSIPGMNHDLEEKLRQGFTAWVDAQRAIVDYQVVLADTWIKAFERLMQALVEQTRANTPIDGVRQFLTQWSEIADDVFKAALRSDAYVTMQSKLVNAMMHYRVQQRQIIEMVLKHYDLPTRSEMDETHRRIYELRKEIKSLKKEMAALKADTAEESPAVDSTTHATNSNGKPEDG